MEDHSELYSTEITEETHKELVDFIKWYNKSIGHEPLIVGGWAAWAYHKGLGSKDIDVVFPSGPSMHQTLLQYFKANNYETRETSFFTYEFYKKRKTKKIGEVDVIVDAVASDRNVTVDGTKIIIPWRLSEKYKRRFKFAEDTDAYIIEPELLFVYKVGALIGRDAKLKTAVEAERVHYESKLWKDARDVLGLLEKVNLDYAKIFYILHETGIPLGNEYLNSGVNVAFRYFEPPESNHFYTLFSEVRDAVIGYESLVKGNLSGDNYDIDSLRVFSRYPDLMVEITKAIFSNIKKKIREDERKRSFSALRDIIYLSKESADFAKEAKNADYLFSLEKELSERMNRDYLHSILHILQLR